MRHDKTLFVIHEEKFVRIKYYSLYNKIRIKIYPTLAVLHNKLTNAKEVVCQPKNEMLFNISIPLLNTVFFRV